jgi:EAL domain-containing protein (putative c-di-GMP-specific phosphodiesterase class I)
MLPVQQLKIDQSFVFSIGANKCDEGVETEEQAAFFSALSCQKLQGFLHGRVVASADFRDFWSTLNA